MVSNFIAATDVYMLYRLSVAEYLVQSIDGMRVSCN